MLTQVGVRPATGAAVLLCAAVSMFVSGADPRAQVAPARALLVRNGTLIDGTGAAPRPGTSVLISGGRIQKVGPDRDLAGAAGGATVIDATGKFILPGLIDSHVHYLEWETPYYPYFGVTTIYDLGNLSEWIVAQRQATRAGLIPGARLYTTGNHINGPATPGSEVRAADRAGYIHIVTDRKSTLEALGILASYPVDALKIQERLNDESLQTIVEYGNERRLPVVGHVVNARDAANVGVRFLEHMMPIVRATTPNASLNEAEMDPARFDDLIALLVEKKVWVNPTAALLHVQASSQLAQFRKQDEALYPTLTGVPQSVKDVWMREFYADEKLRAERLAGWPNVKAFLAKFIQRGGRILSGTDAGRRIMPGLALHREMQVLVEIGMTPMEAIKSSTTYAAEFFGLEKEIGAVAPGLRGDLLILDADPLADIANTQRISQVVLEGQVVDRSAKALAYRNPMARPVYDEPIPAIDAVTPLRFVQGDQGGVVTIRGRNFNADTVVQIGTTVIQPKRNGDGSLAVAVPPSITNAVGTYELTAVNPLPGGGRSSSRYIFVDFGTARR